MRTTAILAIGLLAALVTGPIAAESPHEPQCVRAGDLPPPFGDWDKRTPLAAATHMTRARPVLAVGRSTELTLHPAGSLRYEIAPGKPPKPNSFGGMASVMIDRPGVYHLGLGSGAWVEMVRAGKAVGSVAHSHGPACTGLRKIVDFRLTPGRYTVQVSGAPTQGIAIKLVRVP